MSDRELLEKAAKAAGIRLLAGTLSSGDLHVDMPSRGDTWNPLTDDGDAMRLAVKLGIKTRFNSALNQAFAWHGQQEIAINLEGYGNDPYAATRRAIVRAAAEIGKGMP